MVSHKANTTRTKVDRISDDSPQEALRKALARADANRKESLKYLSSPCENEVEIKWMEAAIELLSHENAQSSSDSEATLSTSDVVAVGATRTRLNAPTTVGVPDAWIADTGSGYDLVARNEVPKKLLKKTEVPSRAPSLRTANGPVKPNECVPIKLGPLPQTCLLYTSDAADE